MARCARLTSNKLRPLLRQIPTFRVSAVNRVKQTEALITLRLPWPLRWVYLSTMASKILAASQQQQGREHSAPVHSKNT